MRTLLCGGSLRSAGLLGLFVSGFAFPAALGAGEAAVDIVVDIPSVVALDVKGDLVFDLSKLPGPSSPNDCENVFPPGSACKAAIYDPTGARGITVAVFDNSEKGSTILQEKVAPDWSRALPGSVSTTDLQARPINETLGKSTQPVKTSLAEIARIPAAGRWTTLTRSFRLVAPASGLKETPREGIQTTITYSVSHAE